VTYKALVAALDHSIAEATIRNIVRELRVMLACDDICSKEFSHAKEVCVKYCIQFFKNFKR